LAPSPLSAARIHTTLLRAFPTEGDLACCVGLHLHENLYALAKLSNLSDMIYELCHKLEARGRLGDLLTAAYTANPTKADLAALLTDYQAARSGAPYFLWRSLPAC
jgi:hypothetical protein